MRNPFSKLEASFVRLLLFALFAAIISPALQAPVSAQVRPIYDRGVAGLVQSLKRLQTVASAMHTGAHPDDEDSGLLAYLARKESARTAYLSLNRGDGGQNVIGGELFEALGVIRTEELLQARRLDGGTQFFTRVMDYGFSKTRAEAASIWGEREVLSDMVRAIRIFRPLVIMSRFSGTPADGHGQHQLAGYLSPIAFKAAADPNEFPEQIREGLRPWQARKFYVGQGFTQNPNNAPTIVMNTGEYDFLLGRSYFEIAMEGRSQHKSQEMGLLELRGPQSSGFRLAESVVKTSPNEKSIFDGIDTSIKAIAGHTNNTDEPFAARLSELESTAREALENFDPLRPEKIVPVLARGYDQARTAEMSTRNHDSRAMLREKQREFAVALQLAAGIVVDALADVETINPGDSTNVAVRIFAAEGSALKLNSVKLRVPEKWVSQGISEPPAQPQVGFRPRREFPFASSFFKITAPATAEYTQPYWLEKPRRDFTFDWTSAGSAMTFPFAEPLVTAEVEIEIAGVKVNMDREVQYRYADDIRGELRREFNVVPALTPDVDSDLLIAPISSRLAVHKLVMTVTNNSPRESAGSASFEIPTGWKISPSEAKFSLMHKGDSTAISFDVTIPANTAAGTYELRAIAKMNGTSFDKNVREIAYPHIQTHRLYSTAKVTARVMPLSIASVRVGYITGSGDKVPEAIRRLGLPVTFLDEKMLATGDLSQFDTIVVGIRASQVRPDFVANNGRLLNFVKEGGTLIVQYQQQEYIRLGLQPYPAKMDRNVRVTDENAEVRVLDPENPIFNFPNKIGPDDWKNWVQERNLYSFSDFGPEYKPLLATHDPGEDDVLGGMLYARIGKGNYIYTSYSWFRQLPSGTTGAYRLFANMLGLPKAGK